MYAKIKEFLKCKVIVAFIALIIGIVSIYFLGNDNIIEECSEHIIKEEIGIDLDLTPNSKEKL